MTDSRYSLNKDEEVTLNSNGPYSPHDHVMVEPSDRTNNHASRYKRSRIFTLIIVLLLVTCAVLIVLYTIERGKRKQAEQRGQDVTSSEVSSRQVCTSEHCVKTASVILENLDKTTDPCDNFYMFACGGWKQEHPIPKSMSSWNQVKEIEIGNANTMRRLLNSKETRDKYSKNTALLKVYDFYDACKNIQAIEKAGISPLNSTIVKYGSWSITDSGLAEPWDFYTVLTSIHRELNIEPLVKLQVLPDIKNSSIHRIMISQTRHTITRQSYLKNSSFHEKVALAYKKLMVDVVTLLGAQIVDVETQLNKIFEFEKALAKISLPKDETVDEIKLYKLVTIKQLTQYSNNQLDWHKILSMVFKDVHVTFKDDDKVVVLGLEYIKKLALLLQNTSQSVLRNYMMWQVVVKLAPGLGRISEPAYQHYHGVVDGSSGTIAVWEKCVDEMSSSDLGDPLGLLFIDEKFRKESLVEVSKLISDQREVFITNLQNLDWMDEITKEKATDKAKAIRQNIGYPSYLRNQEELDRRYKELTIIRSSYFFSELNLRRFTVYKRLSSLKEPVDKNRWIIPPQTVNAFYDRVRNKITFPAGFLQPPFFDRNFPRAVSYGGIGIVVAHEITHGFDSNGRKFDKMGDHSNWWTQSSNDAFIRKSQCFIEQYSNITAYDTNLNGVQTLGENIADNGAIKQAYMAYKSWVTNHMEEPKLPGMKYTNDQLFFISAAQVDCGNVRPQTAKRWIEEGTHTLSRWRVTLEMSNSKEFSEAFKCPVGSPMNPANKCQVW